MSVHGPSKADISYIDNDDGTAQVSYVIWEPGNNNNNVSLTVLDDLIH